MLMRRMSQTAVPPLEEILDFYKKKDILAFEDEVRVMAERIRMAPTEIDPSKIQIYASQLMVWPLIETYYLWQKSLDKQLAGEELAKLDELGMKQSALIVSDDSRKLMQNLNVDGNFRIRFLNPYQYSRDEFISIVLSVMCGPLEKHVRRTRMGNTKILHDAQMGGTVYIAGDDLKNPKVAYQNTGSTTLRTPAYSFLQRSFVCIDRKSQPFLFMDNVEGGCPYFRRLDHWRGMDEDSQNQVYPNRIQEAFFGLAAAMNMASQLGLAYVVPRDFELVELARLLGVRERRVFLKDSEWKIGLKSETPYTGVYTHSLYRGNGNHDGHQLRHPIMDIFPYSDPEQMIAQIKRLEAEIVTENWDRRTKATPKTFERLKMMSALNDIIQAYPLMPKYIQDSSLTATTNALRVVGPLIEYSTLNNSSQTMPRI